MSIKIETLYDRCYGQNCYIIWDEQSRKCAVIDPAVYMLTDRIKAYSLKPVCVLLTHGHFDHICGVDKFLEEYDVPVYIHENDAELLGNEYKNASYLSNMPVTTAVIPQKLKDGDVIALGDINIRVLHTPGHTRGCVCYFAENAVFTGDTVFACGEGRTDLYGGDEQTLIETLKNLMPKLRGKTIYPGHGPSCNFENLIIT